MKINLLDPAGYVDGQPYDQFRWLREHDPVHWHEAPAGGAGFWAVTRYADARAMLSDPATFSSSPSTTLDDHASHGDEDHGEVIFADPPRHTEHRKFLSAEFSLRAMKGFELSIQQVADDVIDEVIEKGECDLVTDIAGKLASYSIAELLGLPRQDLVGLYDATDRLLNSADRTQGEGLAAAEELLDYARRTWATRGERPQDDFVTRLANGSFGGRDVDELQFTLDLFVIINAGGDTTRNAFSGGMLGLLDCPDQRAALEQDPDLLRKAVDEMLRWVSPIAYQRRTATRDTELRGRQIAKGQRVVTWSGAANRDPAIFVDAERFNIHRSPNPHITFGYATHHCVGFHLAKIELSTMLQEVLRRMPDLELASPATWLRADQKSAPLIVGPKSIPVRFSPAAAKPKAGNRGTRPTVRASSMERAKR